MFLILWKRAISRVFIDLRLSSSRLSPVELVPIKRVYFCSLSWPDLIVFLRNTQPQSSTAFPDCGSCGTSFAGISARRQRRLDQLGWRTAVCPNLLSFTIPSIAFKFLGFTAALNTKKVMFWLFCVVSVFCWVWTGEGALIVQKFKSSSELICHIEIHVCFGATF